MTSVGTWSVGAMDEKRILVKNPINTSSYYFNYEGTFGILLLALVHVDYKW